MRFLFIALFIFGYTCQVHADRLPASVRNELKQSHIPQSAVAIEVRELGKHSSLISLNTARPMNPASTMKLLTTYAGLELLGPAFAWKTEAWLDGELHDGVLEGNLVLKGYGDPKFTIEQFWLWLSELRSRGLREIRGDLVLDRSFFELPPYDPADFDNDPARAYNVVPDALLLNFNTLRMRYQPDGNRFKVSSEPAFEGITFDNQLKSQPATNGCVDWDDFITVQPGGDIVVFQGGYPSDCGPREHNLSVLPHTRYVEGLFRMLWLELNGKLQGKSRDGMASSNASLFSTHYSAPLSEVIRDINKFSNNVMARQLFLTLGTTNSYPPLLENERDQQAGSATTVLPFAPANIERSTLAIHQWLARKNLRFPELILENGAGLSRKERISANHMTQLLQSVYDSPLNAELMASLPILGVDGSVKKRLKESSAASHAHLKTGTLEGVKTIAGYVHSHSGREWIVVFLINHPYAKFGQDAQDALIEWVQQKY
jgi:D-alanyl-D-alanine carboxypeptidase/D-alanyl-D-alanine-endopeptidase (penicillin-binding protein 4)